MPRVRTCARRIGGNAIETQVVFTLKARLVFSQRETTTMLIPSGDNGCTGPTYRPQFWVQVRQRLRDAAVRLFSLFCCHSIEKKQDLRTLYLFPKVEYTNTFDNLSIPNTNWGTKTNLISCSVSEFINISPFPNSSCIHAGTIAYVSRKLATVS